MGCFRRSRPAPWANNTSNPTWGPSLGSLLGGSGYNAGCVKNGYPLGKEPDGARLVNTYQRPTPKSAETANVSAGVVHGCLPVTARQRRQRT